MFSREDLLSLIERRATPSVSIYMQSHTGGPEVRKDPIRFKNLVARAKQGLSRADAAVLAPAEALINGEGSPWRHMEHGLAFFASPKGHWMHKLPVRVEERVVVGDRFHIRPLLSLLDDSRYFFVLAASESEATLFRGDRERLDQVEDAELGEAFESIRANTELAADVGYHGSGGTTPRYHALGEAPEDYLQTELDRYASGVAKAVERYLGTETAPLVLVAEPNLLGMLRRHCDYRGLAGEAINKSPAGLSLAEVHEAAMARLRPVLDRPVRDLIERFGAEQGGGGRASEDPAEILPAALEGRVEGLLIAMDAEVWGMWDGEAKRTAVHGERGKDSDDLVDLMAAAALRTGSEVRVIERAAMPDGAEIAALFRY